MATLNKKLGRTLRLYVADTDTPATDADYVALVNENEIELSASSDEDTIDVKETTSKISTGGTVEYTLSATLDEVFTDPGYQALPAVGSTKSFQLRDLTDAAAPKVVLEGVFSLTERTTTAGARGIRQTQITLSGAGEINETPRDVQADPAP